MIGKHKGRGERGENMEPNDKVIFIEKPQIKTLLNMEMMA